MEDTVSYDGDFQQPSFPGVGTDTGTAAEGSEDLDEIETLAQLNDEAINSTYEAGRTKMGVAARQGNIRQVESLLYEGGSANETDEYGETALHLAAVSGQVKMVKFLVEDCRAEVNAPNWEGWTPLFWAATRGQVEIAKYLIEMGADVEMQASHDWLPLHLAALNGDLAMVQALLEAGADPAAENNFGCTPLSLAGNADVAALLEEHLNPAVARVMSMTSKHSSVDGMRQPSVSSTVRDRKPRKLRAIR